MSLLLELVGWWVGVNSCWLVVVFLESFVQTMQEFFLISDVSQCECFWCLRATRVERIQYKGDFHRKVWSDVYVCYETVRVAHVHLILPSWLQPCDNANTSFSMNFLHNPLGVAWISDETRWNGACFVLSCSILVRIGWATVATGALTAFSPWQVKWRRPWQSWQMQQQE